MIGAELEIPRRKPRRYLPEDFTVADWNSLKPYYEKLKNRNIGSTIELEQWMFDRSELEAVLREDLSWRYIKMTIDTTNKEYEESYRKFVVEIQPNVFPYSHELDLKLVNSPYLDKLEDGKYEIYLKKVKNRINLFTEKNIPLFSELNVKEKEFGTISGNMSIEYKGKELTMQQAANYLKSTNRSEREEVYRLINDRRQQDAEALNNLFDELIKLRHQIALNAGFKNYRDYKFAELNRFDYGVEDCFEFHEAIRKQIVPIDNEMLERRKQKLGLEDLRPWDLAVDPEGKEPLKPFVGSDQLVGKVKEVFYKLHPYFGERLEIMQLMKHLDLESRKGKSPGGYNSTLSEIGVPFIFMNASGSSRDVRTMIHEGGHAIHSFLMRDIAFTPNRSIPSEVAELASMSMELMTMDHWSVIYADKDDLKRARIEQLEGIFNILPWVAIIDKFQHWIYTNPEHSHQERAEKWNEIFNQYSSTVTNWEGLEHFKDTIWQKQLHLFEVPFYYIEYAIAQLGALAMWRQYKQDSKSAVVNYMKALSLGYSKPISTIYETAGIKFDFSQEYVSELADFINEELKGITG